MFPIAITVSNYRSFALPMRLELRPLTLLYGQNNAGKSALVRLLALLGDSVAESATAPLELTGEAGRKASFLSVLWRGDQKLPPQEGMQLGLDWPDGAGIHRIEYVIDYSREKLRTYVRSLRVYDGRESLAFEAEAYPGQDGQYDVRVRGQAERRCEIVFVGLVPAPSSELSLLDEVHKRMVGLRGRIQWLGAVRARPERLIEATGSIPRRLSADGREAVDVLLAEPEVRAEVSAWYERHCDRVLELKAPTPGHYYRTFLNPRHTAMEIDLVDTGEGMIQCLPVLVAAALARHSEEGTLRLLAMEEPESHLHPDLQRALAEHLSALAAAEAPPIIVLETHSLGLLLGVQLSIARGQISPERVGAYWVEQQENGQSLAALATFDRLGRPERNWPPGIFADERQLARELAQEHLVRLS